MQLFSFLYIFVIIMGSSRSLLTVAQQVVRLESQGYRRMMQMACPCSIIVVTSDMQIRCRYTLIHRTTRPSCVLFFFPCGCEINCALFAQSRSAPSDRLKKKHLVGLFYNSPACLFVWHALSRHPRISRRLPLFVWLFVQI